MIDPAKSMGDDVKAYFVTNGIPRADIFVNNAPKNKNNFILITDTPGAAPEQYYPLDHPSVQIACYGEAAKHAATWTLINTLFDLLNRKQNIMIGSREAMYSRATQSPYPVGLDPEKNRWLMVFNVQFKIRGVDGH